MIPQALVSEKSAERKITLFAKTNIQFIDLDIIVDDELYNQTNPYLKLQVKKYQMFYQKVTQMKTHLLCLKTYGFPCLF